MNTGETQLDIIDKIKQNVCLFCPEPIKMKESIETYERSGTSDHYYDYTDYYVSLTHSSAEQVFCFKIELAQGYYYEGCRHDVKNNKSIKETIDKEFERLTILCDKEKENMRINLKEKISLKGIIDKPEIYEKEAIDAIIYKISNEIKPDKEKMLISVSEMMFEDQSERRDLKRYFSKRALEIGKEHPSRRLRENTKPYCLKSHLDCWPYGKFGKLEMRYIELYSKIHKEHMKNLGGCYPELFKELKGKNIILQPET